MVLLWRRRRCWLLLRHLLPLRPFRLLRRWRLRLRRRRAKGLR